MILPTQIELRQIDCLLPYARNSRTHSDEQVAQVAASIVEFGWTNPILVGADGVIIAGHARVQPKQIGAGMRILAEHHLTVVCGSWANCG